MKNSFKHVHEIPEIHPAPAWKTSQSGRLFCPEASAPEGKSRSSITVKRG
jgi:hypothetical protein